MSSIWKDGIYGFIVGDALGVPVEFTSREERKLDPVVGMREYGTYNQPKGTWSDDSSMTLATIDSIKHCKGIDYDDLMKRFYNWNYKGEYTPFGEVFDVGHSTSRAIINFAKGEVALNCGGKTEWENGNGSLMRILPICLYLYERQKMVCTSQDESLYIVHNVSALTHAHLRSQMACGIYYFIVKSIIDEKNHLIDSLQDGINNAFKYYRRDFANFEELKNYNRLTDLMIFKNAEISEIKSTGYVIDTLEAVIWCLITTNTYKDAMLKAVNLGDDTDTIAAIAGGLAGLYYGYDDIPISWLDAVQCKNFIDDILANHY